MLGRALPSRNEQGEIIQWIGTYTDIHEHKLALERIDQAQRQLRENNAQLIRVNVDLDNFIYTASHDLKAPISNIEGLLHALLSELPCQRAARPRCSPSWTMMQDSVDRFKRTIEQLTDVSQAAEGARPAATQPWTWPPWCTACASTWSRCCRTGAVLELDVAADAQFRSRKKTCAPWCTTCSATPSSTAHPGPAAAGGLRTRPVAGALLEVQDNGLGIDRATPRSCLACSSACTTTWRAPASGCTW